MPGIVRVRDDKLINYPQSIAKFIKSRETIELKSDAGDDATGSNHPPSYGAPVCLKRLVWQHCLLSVRTHKLKSHLVRTQSLKVLPFKPGVGQYK